MSAEYKGQNPLDITKQAKKDLNSHANVHGTDPNTANPNRGPNASDSATESGIDESAVNKFPGATVTGGSINPATGKLYEAGDFEKGVGAPEVKDASYATNHGGEPDANAPVRQGQGQTGR
ncbi:hypothetical protein EJ07DRAFT_179714 [Lizonia empirigonia]|nr:hypothetical protein EJ07DRAFT_179714 [Lizonia empirigonia]